jgi:hypothetical protein
LADQPRLNNQRQSLGSIEPRPSLRPDLPAGRLPRTPAVNDAEGTANGGAQRHRPPVRAAASLPADQDEGTETNKTVASC